MDEKNYDSWEGGHPWDDDLFEKNAKEKGLEIGTEKNKFGQEVSYVFLKNDTVFYHATRESLVSKIQKDGLALQDKGGKQEQGVYLAGGDHLKEWRGKETRLFKVVVRKGTKLYQDFQSNAVYIKTSIPSNDVQLVEKEKRDN